MPGDRSRLPPRRQPTRTPYTEEVLDFEGGDQFQTRPYPLTSCIPIRSPWKAPGGRSWRPESRQARRQPPASAPSSGTPGALRHPDIDAPGSGLLLVKGIAPDRSAFRWFDSTRHIQQPPQSPTAWRPSTAARFFPASLSVGTSRQERQRPRPAGLVPVSPQGRTKKQAAEGGGTPAAALTKMQRTAPWLM